MGMLEPGMSQKHGEIVMNVFLLHSGVGVS